MNLELLRSLFPSALFLVLYRAAPALAGAAISLVACNGFKDAVKDIRPVETPFRRLPAILRMGGCCLVAHDYAGGNRAARSF